MARCEEPGLKLSPDQKELDRLKKEVQKTKEAIKSQEKEEQSILSRLNEIDKEMDKRRKEVDIYEFNLKTAQKNIEVVNARIAEMEREIKRDSERLKGRLRAIYKSGGVSLLRVVFSSGSLSEILQSVTMMRYIASYDAHLLERLRHNRDACLKKKEEFEEYRERVKQYNEIAMRERAALIKQQSERIALLESVRKDKAKQVSLLENMERRSKDLRRLIEKSDLQGIHANFEALKGKLRWPVKGTILIPFGSQYDPVLKRKIVNNGLDIKAPVGSEVFCIASGRVLYSGWFYGYGKLLIIDHGLGYNSIYAHAQDIFVNEGQMVKEGEKVATVGDTDSFRGPELYFEIRFKGSPVNPAVWLSK
ncbi:peptidoglycan DD-metalloendopeptidase family protein [bacterium]|nr:peptidoglycan DD-metalloendopeptidase family protein [bacterium]